MSFATSFIPVVGSAISAVTGLASAGCYLAAHDYQAAALQAASTIAGVVLGGAGQAAVRVAGKLAAPAVKVIAKVASKGTAASGMGKAIGSFAAHGIVGLGTRGLRAAGAGSCYLRAAQLAKRSGALLYRKSLIRAEYFVKVGLSVGLNGPTTWGPPLRG